MRPERLFSEGPSRGVGFQSVKIIFFAGSAAVFGKREAYSAKNPVGPALFAPGFHYLCLCNHPKAICR